MSLKDDATNLSVGRKLSSLIDWQKYQEEQVAKAEQFNARLKQQLKELLNRSADAESSWATSSTSSSTSNKVQNECNSEESDSTNVANISFDYKTATSNHFKLHDISEEESGGLTNTSDSRTTSAKSQNESKIQSRKKKLASIDLIPCDDDNFNVMKATTAIQPVDSNIKMFQTNHSYALQSNSTPIEKHVIRDSIENCPIRPAIDGTSVQSFEQYLDKQIRETEAGPGNVSNSSLQPSIPKRSFLRKGSGLRRFRLIKDDEHSDLKPEARIRPCRLRRLQTRFNLSTTNHIQSNQDQPPKPSLDSIDRLSKPKCDAKLQSLDSKSSIRRIRTSSSTSKSSQTDLLGKSKSRSEMVVATSRKHTNAPFHQKMSLKRHELSHLDSNETCDCANEMSNSKQQINLPQPIEIVSNVGKSTNSAQFNVKQVSNESYVTREPAEIRDDEVDTCTFDQLSTRLLDAIRAQDTTAIDVTLRQMIRHHFNQDLQHLIQRSAVHLEDKAINTESIVQDQTNLLQQSDESVYLNRPSIHTHTIQLRNEIEVLQRKLTNMQLNVNMADRLILEDKQNDELNVSTQQFDPKGEQVLFQNEADKKEQKILMREVQKLRMQMNGMMQKLTTIESNYDKSITKKTPSLKEDHQIDLVRNQNSILNKNQYGKYTKGSTALSDLIKNGHGNKKCKEGELINQENGNYRIFEKKYQNGTRETHLQNGTILRLFADGTEIIDYVNGEREIRTLEYRRREMVDGSTKTVYSDGTQETRYANGRLRVKDKFNRLIADSKFLFNKI